MPIFNFSELDSEMREMKTYSDPETGCRSYDDQVAFEACRQSYFLKQQNETPKQQENNNNSELEQKDVEQKNIESMKSQLEIMQQKLELQEKEMLLFKTQQDTQIPQKDNIFFTDSQGSLVLCLLIILVVGFTTGILFAKKIVSRSK